eukprot:766383_1
MSHIKDSFDDDELTALADEIRQDLLKQPNLDPNDSFVFKLQIDDDEQTKHKSPPSWSYLTLSNTEDDTYQLLTPYTPNIITPLTPHLISNDSFPDITSPQTSLGVSINNGYNWVNKSPHNLSSPQLALTNISSINSDSTIISPRKRKQKTNIAEIPDFIANSNESNKIASKQFTFYDFKKKK